MRSKIGAAERRSQRPSLSSATFLPGLTPSPRCPRQGAHRCVGAARPIAVPLVAGGPHPHAYHPHHPCQTMSPRIVGRAQVRLQRPKMASPPARFMITQRVAWRDVHTPKGAQKWRWGTVAAVALSKTDDGQLAYEYLIAGGDGFDVPALGSPAAAAVRRRSRPVPRGPDDGRRRRTSRDGNEPGRDSRPRQRARCGRVAGASATPRCPSGHCVPGRRPPDRAAAVRRR